MVSVASKGSLSRLTATEALSMLLHKGLNVGNADPRRRPNPHRVMRMVARS
jgi:hypothetical protein